MRRIFTAVAAVAVLAGTLFAAPAAQADPVYLRALAPHIVETASQSTLTYPIDQTGSGQQWQYTVSYQIGGGTEYFYIDSAQPVVPCGVEWRMFLTRYVDGQPLTFSGPVPRSDGWDAIRRVNANQTKVTHIGTGGNGTPCAAPNDWTWK